MSKYDGLSGLSDNLVDRRIASNVRSKAVGQPLQPEPLNKKLYDAMDPRSSKSPEIRMPKEGRGMNRTHVDLISMDPDRKKIERKLARKLR